MNEKLKEPKLQKLTKTNHLVNTIATYDNKLILLVKYGGIRGMYSLPEMNRSFKYEKSKLDLLQLPCDSARDCFKNQTGLILSIDDVLGNYLFEDNSQNSFDNHVVIYGSVNGFDEVETKSGVILIDPEEVFKREERFSNKNHYKMLVDWANLPMKEKYLI